MDIFRMPVFEYCGDLYQKGILEKVAMDWTKKTIRGSLKKKT